MANTGTISLQIKANLNNVSETYRRVPQKLCAHSRTNHLWEVTPRNLT